MNMNRFFLLSVLFLLPFSAFASLDTAVTDMLAVITGAAEPALNFVVGALGFMLAPKILIRIFHMVF